MKLLNLFGRKTDTPPPEIENDEDELEIYSGMRVEVTAFDGRMLFVAKLMGLHGNRAERISVRSPDTMTAINFY